ncbi:MAG TPA: chemotaxis protein CheX [Nocardioides sp.]
MSAVLDEAPALPAAADVLAIAEEVVATYLGADEPLLEVGPGAPAAAAVVSGSVGVTGTARATVTVELDEAAAGRVAVLMLGLDGIPAPEDVADAVGELVNMIGGNVKSLLPEPSVLSLPVVTAGRVLGAADPVVDLHCLWGPHPVRVTVHVPTSTTSPQES